MANRQVTFPGGISGNAERAVIAISRQPDGTAELVRLALSMRIDRSEYLVAIRKSLELPENLTIKWCGRSSSLLSFHESGKTGYEEN